MLESEIATSRKAEQRTKDMFKDSEIKQERLETTERRLLHGKLLPISNSQRDVDGERRDYYNRKLKAIDDLMAEVL